MITIKKREDNIHIGDEEEKKIAPTAPLLHSLFYCIHQIFLSIPSVGDLDLPPIPYSNYHRREMIFCTSLLPPRTPPAAGSTSGARFGGHGSQRR